MSEQLHFQAKTDFRAKRRNLSTIRNDHARVFMLKEPPHKGWLSDRYSLVISKTKKEQDFFELELLFTI
jgi:diadenosine tetraphosphate (Ap4A) HIT family hydrolase